MTATVPSDLALVPFVSVDHMMQLVHHIGIENMLAGLSDYIEDDFRRWELFDKTPRVASHSQEGVIELMPTSDGEVYGFKYVNGHPKNTKEGLQTVTAFGLLADVYTGYPVLLSEMTILTALRTAATSAMVAKHLAPENATTMAMIGNGAQSEFQALAMKAICGVKALRMYDIDKRATEKAIGNLEGWGFELTACKTPEEAIEGAQVITTCTADIARARPSCTRTSCTAPTSLPSSCRRPASRANCSRWTMNIRRQRCGRSSPGRRRAG
jgi:ornithine cyclodeaminase